MDAAVFRGDRLVRLGLSLGGTRGISAGACVCGEREEQFLMGMEKYRYGGIMRMGTYYADDF